MLSLPGGAVDAASGPYRLDADALRTRLQLPAARQLDAVYAGLDLAAEQRRSGLRLVTLTRAQRFGRYRCGAPSAPRLDAAARAALATFGRYPAALLRRAGLAFVVFCAGLRNDAGGRPGGVPNAAAGTLLFDLGYVTPALLPAALHHEFYHLFDEALDGSYADPDWERVNPIGFRYYGSDRLTLNASAGFGSGGYGFVTAYARASVAEDKAELFRWLLTDPRRLSALAHDDPVLRAKIARLRSELRPYAPGLFGG